MCVCYLLEWRINYCLVVPSRCSGFTYYRVAWQWRGIIWSVVHTHLDTIILVFRNHDLHVSTEFHICLSQTHLSISRIAFCACYANNVWSGKNFPFLSQDLFYENGTVFDQLTILDDKLQLDPAKLAVQVSKHVQILFSSIFLFLSLSNIYHRAFLSLRARKFLPRLVPTSLLALLSPTLLCGTERI